MFEAHASNQAISKLRLRKIKQVFKNFVIVNALESFVYFNATESLLCYV